MVSLLLSYSTSSGWNNSLAASVTVDDGLSATKERIARSRSPIGTVYRMTSLLYDCSQKILRPVLICVVVIVTTEMVFLLAHYLRIPILDNNRLDVRAKAEISLCVTGINSKCRLRYNRSYVRY